jgi:hypothetical protein
MRVKFNIKRIAIIDVLKDRELFFRNINEMELAYAAQKHYIDLLTAIYANTYYYIEDNIRYEGAYLVASGGQTKNKLAIWDKLYDSGTYGNYGYWDILVDSTGEAIIMNLGNSLGKYLQYNVGNHPALFACYEEPNKIPICIYRLTIEGGDEDEEDIETGIQYTNDQNIIRKAFINNQLVIISGNDTYTILGTKL